MEKYPRLDKKNGHHLNKKLLKYKQEVILFILLATCIIYHAHGLILDHLAFDSTIVTKHGLTHITSSTVQSREHLYLFLPLSMIFFQIDPIVINKMNQLITIA